MTPERKKLIIKLREEGYYAALKGQHRESCPHKHMNKYQWLRGFEQGEKEVAHAEQEGTNNASRI